MKKPLFDGLVYDEYDRLVKITYVGDDPCYVIEDQNFLRHIPSEKIDRQIFNAIKDQIAGHEELISSQTAQMIGQDDPFTRAMINTQLKHIDDQFEAILQSGIPEEARTYLGMMGFKVIINFHGDVIEIKQPGTDITEGEE
jgi:hypothetical protein